MKWILFCIIWVLSCCACNEKKTGGPQTFVVDVNHKSDKNFDDFYRLKEIIRLEVNDSVLLDDIKKVIAVKDRIFVMSWRSTAVFVFDREGKYLSKIDRVGRGEGEYLTIADMMVMENPQEVIVYAKEGRLNYYDWDGRFLRMEKRPGMVSNMERLPDGGWLANLALMQSGSFHDTMFMVRSALPNGAWTKGYFPLPKFPAILPVTMVSAMYADRGSYYVAPITENTIYEYDLGQQEFIPRYVFEVETYPLPDVSKLTFDDLKNNFFYDYFVLSGEYIGEKTVYVSAYYGRKGRMLYWIADKNIGKVEVFDSLNDKGNELPLSHYMQHSGFEGDIVVYAMPMWIKEYKFQNESSVGSRLSKELSDEDNPVLLVYEEK